MNSFHAKYGPWALVTGASSGMGAAFARHLAEQKLSIVLVARREDRLRELSQELEQKMSVQTRVIPADLSREDFMPTLQEATQDLEIGLLVNNAGTEITGDFLSNDLDAELKMLNLNSRTPLILTHHYGTHMRNRHRGGIIFLSSVVALAGLPQWSQYAATKGHNLLFAEGLAEELSPEGVDVLAVSPGFTRTELLELSPLGRMMSMDADAVVRTALKNLGRTRHVTPGIHNKLIALSTRFQPRVLNTKIIGTVIKHGKSAQEHLCKAIEPCTVWRSQEEDIR